MATEEYRSSAKFSELLDIGLSYGCPAYCPRTGEMFSVMGGHLDRGLNGTKKTNIAPDEEIQLLPDFPESDYSKACKAKLDEWLAHTAQLIEQGEDLYWANP